MDCQTVRDDLHVEPTSLRVHAHLGGCPSCTAYAERMARLDRVLSGELVTAAPAVLSAQLETLPTAPVPQLSRLDAAVRDELVVPVPDALSARLRALVPAQQVQRVRVSSPVDVALRDALVLQAPTDLTARLQALVPQSVAPIQASAVPAPATPAGPPRWVVATVYAVTSALLLLSLLYAGQVYSLIIAQLGLEQWLAEIAKLPATLLSLLYEHVPYARAVIGVVVSLRQPLQWLLIALVLWAVIDMSQRQRQSYAENTQQYA